MTQLPNPGQEPDPIRNNRPWRRRLKQIGIPVGIVALTGVAGGIWWGWQFVNNDLAPLVEKNLSESLKRPVKLGQVESFSLTSLRIGPSSVPPTATDPDRLTVEAVEVKFNPLTLLLTRDLNLDITAYQPKLYVEQAKDGTWISTAIEAEEQQGPIRTEVKEFRFKQATAVLVPWDKAKARPGQPVQLNELGGRVNFFDRNKRFTYEAMGQSASGGSFDLEGETKRAQDLSTDIKVRGKNFSVSEIDRLANLPGLALQAGRVDGNIGAQIRPNQEIPKLSGSAQFRDVTMQAQGVPKPFTQGKGKLDFNGTEIRVSDATGVYGKVAAQVKGVVDLEQGFDLAINVKSATVPDVLATLQLPVPVPTAGELTADLRLSGALETPVLTGSARNTKPGKIDQIAFNQYSVNFRLDTGKKLLTLTDIKATPTAGGQIAGGGRVTLSEPAQVAMVFDATNIAADGIARDYNQGQAVPVAIGQVNAQAQISGPADNLKILTRWQAPTGTFPGAGELVIANGVTTVRNTAFTVAGGTVNLQGQAANGRWQGNVKGSGVQLKQFSPDLRGVFSGDVALAGSLASFSPVNVRAQGNVRLSEGLAVIAKPLTAQVQWDGQKVIVQNATAPGLMVNGTIATSLEGTPAITAMNLDIRAQDYNLQAFALPLPDQVNYSGTADFRGRLTGTPANPKVVGDLALNQFVLNGVEFDPVLQGTVQVNRGVRLNLVGETDQIAATLDANYNPIDFYVQRGKAIARGNRQGELLQMTAEEFPLALFNTLNPNTQFPLGGIVSTTGPLVVNLKDYSTSGNFAIKEPSFGTYRADEFTGQVRYANGVASLVDAKLTKGTTTFQLGGTASLQGRDPKFEGTLTLEQGRLQDLLTLANISDLEDLTLGLQPVVPDAAQELETVPIELEGSPVLDQLRRLSEIEALLAQEKVRREEAPIPELRELQGFLSGQVKVNGSLKTGVKADFNLRGAQWQWGPYSAKEMAAVGSFENGTITLVPLRFQSDQSVMAFSGQISAKQQSGQFRMENVPIANLQPLAPFKIPVQGQLNANAILAGSLDNPQAIGEISITDGFLNGETIQQARGSFQYTNARLSFDSKLVVTEPEPITITGSLPIRLPFASVFPESDEISLAINVKDDGLAVLNVLNNQVEWVDGAGFATIDVSGTASNPIARGTIQVNNATLKAKAVPDPLTNVNGTISLRQDVINVESVTGNYGRGGKVTASGVLPILAAVSPDSPDASNLLSVQLDSISLSLKGLYRGSVDGQILVLGTALRPMIGGRVVLSRGEVLLTDAAATGTAPSSQEPSPVEFRDLNLTLGNNLRITRAPIINFVAAGNLQINGSIDEPLPSGVITLKSGQINLFTTQFNLERGYSQTATFEPRLGLDPILDVRMVALVSEVVGSRMPTSPTSSEILDAPNFNRFGSLQSVRVRAQVNGPASQLDDNIVLTSSPARSEAEIVALIGGGFVNNLGQGQGALGLANLAGSALLTNVQGAIANALRLSDFRIFPTITPNQGERSSKSDSNLDVALEAGIDITRAISFSVLKILTSDQPAQFGLRYRVNDNILLRGSTDFSGDNRAVLEYEARF